MLKVAIGSDLHLEFGPLTPENKENADVLVLAGDILVASNITPRYQTFFEACSRNFKEVIYIMGNHEHYNGDFLNTPSRIAKFVAQFPNVHFLDKDVFTIGDTTFFGATFWTDFNGGDPLAYNAANRGMNDFRIVSCGYDDEFLLPNKFTAELAAEDFGRAKASLDLLLGARELIENDNKIVVVSHHAPSPKSIHPRYQNDVLINYAYHTDLQDYITQHPEIKLWIHGHTHSTFDYMVGETRVLCNPRGYIGYEARANQFEFVTVEV